MTPFATIANARARGVGQGLEVKTSRRKYDSFSSHSPRVHGLAVGTIS